MFSDMISRGQFENSKWLQFYDTGQTVNEYGQRVIGSALIGSAMCVSIHMGLKTRRTEDGVINFDVYQVHQNRGKIEAVPMRTRVKINGELYEIISKSDGGELTNAVFYTVVKRIG